MSTSVAEFETLPRPRTRKRHALIVLSIVAIVAVLWATAVLVRDRGLDELSSNSERQLDRFVTHLEGALGRFEFLPALLVTNRMLADGLRDADNPAMIDVVNRYLEEVTTITGASDTYLMDMGGTTIAASNWQESTHFVGKNFSFRPYFQQAIQNRRGRYFALGTTSGERGYYFAYPVRFAAEVIGVLVLKMDMSGIEQRWSGLGDTFLVTDPDGIVFISTRPDWLFRSTQALSPMARARIAGSRRYPDQALERLEVGAESPAHGARIVSVRDGDENEGRHLTLTRAMPEAGWDVHILSPIRPIQREVLTTQAIMALLILLLGSLGLLAVQRHRRRQERERIEAAVLRELEHRVRERTSDLTHEIEERRRTEQALRETQDELIQAAKLAVLGELSASISHELNNPLAAIRSYADNALTFLSQDRLEPVQGNLERIVGLTGRMAKISSQLKVFARKSRGQFDTLSVGPVIVAALDIVAPQARRQGVCIEQRLNEAKTQVRGDPIQLEQVVVNLLSNAISILETAQDSIVTLTLESHEHVIQIHVDDNGPGIDPEHLERIFDPFFTTREQGLGLGLSISARIIDSMSGHLSARNRDEGGARFTIALPRPGALS
ncbi:MAG: sensor histidine kinase [Gammaproteobacteria bacterium]